MQKKTLGFEVTIQAPRGQVWEHMLAADRYKTWTAVFNEGARYEGSWEPYMVDTYPRALAVLKQLCEA